MALTTRLVWGLSLALVLYGSARAEQLPVKTYTTADGLLRDQVNRIIRDSHGFLWFCTNDGLSRFDGYSFTNYTTDDGLPHREVNNLLETRSGAIWVAMGNGMAVFNPKGRFVFRRRREEFRSSRRSRRYPGPDRGHFYNLPGLQT
jgi:ligand-binding sensor domain-containing protein